MIRAMVFREDPTCPSHAVIGAALRVHSALGPGLLESVYEKCLAIELERVEVPFERQVRLPIVYQSTVIPNGLRIDLDVAGRLLVEIKAVERVHPIHEAQLLTYMKLANRRVGLLLNFNVSRLRDGIVRRKL